MIPVLLAAALVTCDSAFTALFTPARPAVGHYEVCTTDEPLERVASDTAADVHFSPSELLDPLDAFGTAGAFSPAALSRLYTGRRVRVARGWLDRGTRFESVTLISPHPDATLTKLVPGTMIIRWTTERP